MIKIAQISCGTEYSSVQYEIEKAARSVGAKVVYPDVKADDIEEAVKRFGFRPRSPQLKLMIARAVQLADGKYDADAVWVMRDNSMTATDGYKAISKKFGGYSAVDK